MNNDEAKTSTCSVHYFDSGFSTATGNGSLFRYTGSIQDIIGWRVIDIIFITIPPAVLSNVFHVFGSLPSNSFGNHVNGNPKPIIGTVYRNPVSSPPFSIKKEWTSKTNVCPYRPLDFYFNVTDQDLNPITGARFIVILEFYHCVK